MIKLAALGAMLLLSACGAAGGGDLVNLANDPNSGCVGGGNATFGGAYLCHIGHGTGDSCEVTMSACKITSAGSASASVNPLAALPAGAQMSVQMPPAPKPTQ